MVLLPRPNSGRPIGPALRPFLTLHYTLPQDCVPYYNALNLYYKDSLLDSVPPEQVWAAVAALAARLRVRGRGGWLVGAAGRVRVRISGECARRERWRAST